MKFDSESTFVDRMIVTVAAILLALTVLRANAAKDNDDRTSGDRETAKHAMGRQMKYICR